MPVLTKRNESIYPRESIYEADSMEADGFDEDSEPRPGLMTRASAHGARNLSRYGVGALGVAAGGLAAKQAGRVVGKVRTKSDDPQYDTNYRTGQSQFYRRMRDNQRQREEEGLEEVERLIPAAAIGLGGAHLANKFHSGYRQGQSEKRYSAISKGFDDAWRKTYGKRKEAMTEVNTPDSFEEDSLTEIAGALRAIGSKIKPPKLGTKGKIALGAGAGLGAVGTYQGAKGVKSFGKKVVEDTDGFDEDNGNSVHMEGCGCSSCKMKESELEEKDRYMMRNAPGGVQFAHVRSPALGVFKRKPTYGSIPGKRLVDEEEMEEGIGRVAGETLKWGGRGLAALDIGVLGAQGAKAIANRNKDKPVTEEEDEADGFDEDEFTERVKGQSARTAIEFGAKHSGKVDTALFGAGTVNSARSKGQDLHDDQKLNSSHLRRK